MLRKLLIATAMCSTGSGALAAQTEFEGAGQESRIECDGGRASITGASNRVVVDGPCELLTVEGSGNIVSADMAEKSAIRVTGSSNQVTWRAPGKSRPRISSTGAGNSVMRAR